MWNFVKKKNAIFYFDATGGILKNIPGQKRPYLYSLVCHDKGKKLIIPVADFITTMNDTNTLVF